MSTKRLTDLDVMAAYDSNHPDEHPYGTTLRTDHLQAREDVKRLAERLRGRIGGKCCDFAYATTGTLRCPRCAADEALLAEVEAVRQ